MKFEIFVIVSAFTCRYNKPYHRLQSAMRETAFCVDLAWVGVISQSEPQGVGQSEPQGVGDLNKPHEYTVARS